MKQFVKYPCKVCDRPISNAGFAKFKHLQGHYKRGELEENRHNEAKYRPKQYGERRSEFMNGAQRIAKERQRQIEVEGYTPEHDDKHSLCDLALAAALYATPILLYEKREHANIIEFVDPWPWDQRFDKRPHSGNVIQPNESNDPYHRNRSKRIRQLEIAGALIAAEIDRLLRQSPREEE